jgi:hypothetical protein
MRAKSKCLNCFMRLSTMIVEFAPLIFGTAALLAVFLFFSVGEH